MKYRVDYCVACNIGNVRTANQDNFWCYNRYLQSINNGLAEPLYGALFSYEQPVFAIFDGMGGEEKGEVAAYIAADVFDKLHPMLKNDNHSFTAICNEINSAICTYAEENNISVMGTTGAFVLFAKKEIYICNIGDTPIFRFSNNEITKISFDHIQNQVLNGKPPLTQYLGIPESEFIIQPYLAKGSYQIGDRYLICSDGLTDMVDLEEIKKIISSSDTVNDGCKLLLETALDNGGKDNITIILCEISKTQNFIFRKGVK